MRLLEFLGIPESSWMMTKLVTGESSIQQLQLTSPTSICRDRQFNSYKHLLLFQRIAVWLSAAIYDVSHLPRALAPRDQMPFSDIYIHLYAQTHRNSHRYIHT